MGGSYRLYTWSLLEPDKVYYDVCDYVGTIASHLNESNLEIHGSLGFVSTIQHIRATHTHTGIQAWLHNTVAFMFCYKRTLTQDRFQNRARRGERGSRMMLPGGSRP